MIYRIAPDPACRACRGDGEYSENQSPHGSGYYWPETFTCDCVLDQLPEDFNDREDEVEIVREAEVTP